MARTTFYSKNYIGWPPVRISEVADPDSYYWRQEAKKERDRLLVYLIDQEGDLAHKFLKAWIEELYPDDKYPTWQEFASDLKNLREHYPECECNPNSLVACRICQVTATVINS